MPALISCTQALGEPRYPSLKGIMAARSKHDRHAARWAISASMARLSAAPWRPPRSSTRGRPRPGPPRGSCARPAEEAARQVVAFLAERSLVGVAR